MTLPVSLDAIGIDERAGSSITRSFDHVVHRSAFHKQALFEKVQRVGHAQGLLQFMRDDDGACAGSFNIAFEQRFNRQR